MSDLKLLLTWFWDNGWSKGSYFGQTFWSGFEATDSWAPAWCPQPFSSKNTFFLWNASKFSSPFDRYYQSPELSQLIWNNLHLRAILAQNLTKYELYSRRTIKLHILFFKNHKMAMYLKMRVLKNGRNIFKNNSKAF